MEGIPGPTTRNTLPPLLIVTEAEVATETSNNDETMNNDEPMNNVKVRYGLSNQMTLEFPEGTTVGQVLNDNRVKAGLALPETYVSYIDGEEVGNERVVESGDTITVERKATTKGS